MIKDLILKNRSYRRFDEHTAISEAQLRSWVDLVRLSASGANIQPLKFMLSNQPERNTAIFDCLGWAGYLKEWKGPESGERPAAYIILLGDTEIGKKFDTDMGIAAQSILLGAVEAGYGGCMLGLPFSVRSSVKRWKFRSVIHDCAGHRPGKTSRKGGY